MKASLLLAILIPLVLVGYQNCGQFAVLDAGALSSSSSGLGGGGVFSGLDGLPAGISQSGKIFSRDPGTSARNDSLGFDSDLTPYSSSSSIPHLLNKSFLSDGYAELSKDDAFPSVFADPMGSLEFAPSDSRFDQVNVYYHIDRLIADLAGNSILPSYPLLKVNTHCLNPQAKNNAYYAFDVHTLCLGYTDVSGKRLWAAQDADVVVHEFGHSLNHKYSTDEIMSSTSDIGALDEGFADLWAYRGSRDPRIAMWFGRAIYASAGMFINPFPGLRNLDTVKNYPEAVASEVHDDSLFVSSAVKEIEKKSNLSTPNMAKFEKRLIESLQIGQGIPQSVRAIQDEAPAFGIASSVVSSALSSRGLLRKDPVTEVILDSSKPVFVVDNHKYPTYQSGGNCNGALDAGETVIVYPNLRNTGFIKGGVQVSITSSSPLISIIPGGSTGFFNRIGASGTYIEREIGSMSRSSSTFLNKILGASFIVRANAGATGMVHFDVKVTSMNTLDSVPQIATRGFDLQIGTAAPTATDCGAGPELSVWP